MIENQRAVTVCIHVGKIGNIIAIGFQPAHHRILTVKKKGIWIARPCIDRAVIADLEGSIAIEVLRIVIVRLPCGIYGFKEDVGMTGIVTNDEENVTGTACIITDGFGKIDT
nr:hypothetical protein [Nitrosomonas nitrosa]